MELKRKIQGIWIPIELWETKELTRMEMFFLVEINSLDNEVGCFASNGYFSEFFGLSKTRCSEVINSLEKKGFITIEIQRSGRQIVRRILKVTPYSKNRIPLFGKSEEPYSENLKNLFGKSEEPYSENCKENNININNTKESIARAWDFLKTNNIIRWEAWVMNNHKSIGNMDDFIAHFNEAADLEEIEYTDRKLFARLDRLARNWKRVEKQSKVRILNNSAELLPTHPSLKKVSY